MTPAWAWPEDLVENDTASADLEPAHDTNPLPRANCVRNSAVIEHIKSSPGTFRESASSEFGKAFEPIWQRIQNTAVNLSQPSSVSGSTGRSDFMISSQTCSSTSSTIRHRNFRSPAANSFIRNDGVDYGSYRDQRSNGWNFGGDRPGDPFKTLSYNHTSMGRMKWWELARFGTWFMIWLAMMGYYVWG